MTYLYCGRCDYYTPTEDIFGNQATGCLNCGRTAEPVETCRNCQNEIVPLEWMEDRYGTKFCSVRCCDFYHESAAADMTERR